MALLNWDRLEVQAEYESRRYGQVEINPEKPYESRLAVALACDKRGAVPEAIEAMTGVPLHLYDRGTLQQQMVQRTTTYAGNPQRFYEAFPKVDTI
ncbi:hypothetical protein HYV86_06700 [Candidatus Woesearchaeota archaeon]|nr:hypothetical protein [Candidatus Woesearchaeota archaeon]